MHRMTDRWCRWHLALVGPGITTLGIFHLERPIFGSGEVWCHESLVGRVCFNANGQKMDIPVPYPGNLCTEAGRTSYVYIRTYICCKCVRAYNACIGTERYSLVRWTTKLIRKRINAWPMRCIALYISLNNEYNSPLAWNFACETI